MLDEYETQNNQPKVYTMDDFVIKKVLKVLKKIFK